MSELLNIKIENCNLKLQILNLQRILIERELKDIEVTEGEVGTDTP